jgi:hypothetical protein
LKTRIPYWEFRGFASASLRRAGMATGSSAQLIGFMESIV